MSLRTESAVSSHSGLWQNSGGGTHSDSSVATGHLYCAVLNRQISANCRTVKTKRTSGRPLAVAPGEDR